MTRSVTLQMIADKVGVSKSTVSDVLRARVAKIKVSQATKDRIFQAVKDLNYVPNAAATALVTGKTNTIGFLLSSKTNSGLANNYFSSILSGIQAATKDNGYNCIVNCYDLSSVKEFVMPSKVRRKVVDGLVISGRIEEEILQMFVDSNLPFIIIGESSDFPIEGMLSVARNLSSDWITAFEYLYRLGHRHIAIGGIEAKLGFDDFEKAVNEFNRRYSGSNVKFSAINNSGKTNDVMQEAYAQGLVWAQKSDRPTAVVSHDQWCVAFLSAIMDKGYSCPQDVSVISSCDTQLCQWFRPAITSMELPLFQGAKRSAEVLMDYIDRKINWIEANRLTKNIWTNHKLIIRNSAGPQKN